VNNLDKQAIEKLIREQFPGRRVIVCVSEVTPENKLEYFRVTQNFPVIDIPKFIEHAKADGDKICRETGTT
jgi:hypothetical protein